VPELARLAAENQDVRGGDAGHDIGARWSAEEPTDLTDDQAATSRKLAAARDQQRTGGRPDLGRPLNHPPGYFRGPEAALARVRPTSGPITLHLPHEQRKIRTG